MIRRRSSYKDNYTIIDRRALEDERLSWAARGILAYLMSKPDDWAVSVAQLSKAGNLGRDGIYAALRELEAAGYVERVQGRRDDGTMASMDYLVTDTPLTENPEAAPLTDLPHTAQPLTAGPTLLSTNSNQVLKETNPPNTPPREPDEFRELRSIYPSRAGGQRWRDALAACKARIREGHSWREILDGARRYQAFIRETDREGTEYVLQAATFVGKNKGFLEPWNPPAKKRSAIEKLLNPEERRNGLVQ